MKKKSKIIIACVSLIAIVVVLVVKASIDYKKMSYTEKIKSQLYDEYGIYSETLIDHVEVVRSWYSCDPTDWLYYVTFEGNGNILIYKYEKGIFAQLD